MSIHKYNLGIIGNCPKMYHLMDLNGVISQTYSHVGLINAAFRIAKKIEDGDFI